MRALWTPLCAGQKRLRDSGPTAHNSLSDNASAPWPWLSPLPLFPGSVGRHAEAPPDASLGHSFSKADNPVVMGFAAPQARHCHAPFPSHHDDTRSPAPLALLATVHTVDSRRQSPLLVPQAQPHLEGAPSLLCRRLRGESFRRAAMPLYLVFALDRRQKFEVCPLGTLR